MQVTNIELVESLHQLLPHEKPKGGFMATTSARASDTRSSGAHPGTRAHLLRGI
jgi:hypothetical protein